ncbi:bifunctional ADP-dependent (S)-NAD(P)H-hydrate dehydratase/NAD(P)H-hydrate epimerase [Thalassospira lucentensis]|uniref:Bifunctional NAD(P)H-hydrate repair enzyme n=1 Tax=Thalassospira lucentensis TaxID=168935 RepID=A0A154L915_9PROT|nr:bifunctional ADP-dependent NAD(P)H-hydrate dehydratase/NAD(P)H-hydrate epimerase [Thalassospira lucentensis]KZB67896.1 bifunctional ADP-dependent (S)-NAD(P)H-hydrate dehydratase/NAD(P)H-hydrate epimerase [Thalassospira lucentensis]
MFEILTTEQMYEADRKTIDAGTAGDVLMENAGAAVVAEIVSRWTPRSVTVLCGPGNNGGDGFVVARLLRHAGWSVRLGLLCEAEKLTGDAALNAGRWDGAVERLSPALLVGADLIVDCLFGAGLARSIEGELAELVCAVNACGVPVIAVDVPSGVDGNGGEVRGVSIKADVTVTFCRSKPGHYLLPGRVLCGQLIVCDIGITDQTIRDIRPSLMRNEPGIWRAGIHWPGVDGHKYHRGHLLVVGGASMTGAGRLVARAARRAGAGLLTVVADPSALPVYAADSPGIMTAPIASMDDLLKDCRHNALIIGPGFGVGDETCSRIIPLLHYCRCTVLDADALTSFAEQPSTLFFAIQGPTVLTPHEGEFARLFPDIEGDKLSRARAAAKRSGATVLIKGADTVIAAPDGRAAINAIDAPWLATAGSGDVLAGIIGGLMAQGMEMFDAACMGAWLHARAGADLGPGLIAEDIPEHLPVLLGELWHALPE